MGSFVGVLSVVPGMGALVLVCELNWRVCGVLFLPVVNPQIILEKNRFYHPSRWLTTTGPNPVMIRAVVSRAD